MNNEPITPYADFEYVFGHLSQTAREFYDSIVFKWIDYAEQNQVSPSKCQLSVADFASEITPSEISAEQIQPATEIWHLFDLYSKKNHNSRPLIEPSEDQWEKTYREAVTNITDFFIEVC